MFNYDKQNEENGIFVTTTTFQMVPSKCPICQTFDNATEVYQANFDFAAFNPVAFSARRLPDRIHYRTVRCNSCGLIRSDPVAPPELLEHLYAESGFDYSLELENLKHTYGQYLSKLNDFAGNKNSLLEIGCGNGFFLEEALAQGYGNVHGVEPSRAAVAQAKPETRSRIICDVFRSGVFEDESFDVICMFQLFDHVSDPGVLLSECWRLLRPNGFLLCLNHNVDSWSARILKEKSPIIDIEHTYLYSPKTMRMIFERHGFSTRDEGPVWNRYTLHYLTQLLPFRESIKRVLMPFLLKISIGRLSLSLPLGNLYLIAEKLK